MKMLTDLRNHLTREPGQLNRGYTFQNFAKPKYIAIFPLIADLMLETNINLKNPEVDVDGDVSF